MAALDQRLKDFSDAVVASVKVQATSLSNLLTSVGDLADLTTEDTTSIVAALNAMQATITALESGGGAVINDASAASLTETWSITKISTQIAAAAAGLVDSAPGTLDTLNELAAALGDDANFATTVSNALGNRVRTDTAAQGLDATQQANARTNIGAVSSAAIGDPDTDLAAYYNAALTA